jgi:DNA-binding NarL/FixJ family response regulator
LLAISEQKDLSTARSASNATDAIPTSRSSSSPQSPATSPGLVDGTPQPPGAGPTPQPPRRLAPVLRTAAEGGTTAEIGQALFLSPATVRNDLSNAISKLDARNRIDAIRIARQSGWI